MMKKQCLLVLAAATLALAGASATAHGDAAKPMHSGVVQVASDLQFELVRQPNGAALYVVDHGKPADATRMAGKLTVLNGARKSEAPLKAAGGNKLEAADVELAAGAKVVATVQGADGKALTVRFTVK